ncbi:MAG: CbiX/SirB N-terminal domain-containing protein [Propionibacteriaceae bacterium]|nr:hypothetical protein [Micropruina sp.]
MTAPALVLVSNGHSDAIVAGVTTTMATALATTRRELQVDAAFLDGPNPGDVIDRLVRRGVEEIVLSPLELTCAVSSDPTIQLLRLAALDRHPDVRIQIARPVGPEASLLCLLDRRLRSALARVRCLELDGLVLSSACCGDMRGAALLARRARQWSTHHRLPCVTAAADGSGPSVAQAVASLRSQGRRHIAVGSFFLAPDSRFQAQADLAMHCGAVAVSDPLGPETEVLDLVLGRYAFAAMDLLDFDFPEIVDEPETEPDHDEVATPHLQLVSA